MEQGIVTHRGPPMTLVLRLLVMALHRRAVRTRGGVVP